MQARDCILLLLELERYASLPPLLSPVLSYPTTFCRCVFLFLVLFFIFFVYLQEFSSDILKQLGKIRACNYFSVYKAQDFKRIIDHDFIYVLSPIAFNISLSIRSEQVRSTKKKRKENERKENAIP